MNVQAVEALELKLSDAKIEQIRLRVQRRKLEIAAAESAAKCNSREVGTVDLGDFSQW